MTQPLCFTCRIRDQVARLGEGRASVTGPHQAADPCCDQHAAEIELAGRVDSRSRRTLEAALR